MSDLEFRRQGETRPPRYPCFAPPGGAPQGKPSTSGDGAVAPRAPLISNATFALVPIALTASIPAWSGQVPRVAVTAQEAKRGQEQPAARKPVARLSETEINGLIGDVNEEKPNRGAEMLGRVAIRSWFLTETEVKGLLEGFLRKNGFEAAAGRLGGIELDVVDPAKRIGVKVQREGVPAGLDEIALLKARGEARVLVVDARNFEYDGQSFFPDRLPTKRAAAYALLAELEKFLDE